VVDTIDDWFARVPADGPIEGPIFNEGMGLALLLGDSQRMARHGAGQRAMQTGETASEHDDETGIVTLDAVEIAAETAAPQVSELSFDEGLDVIFGAESATSDTPQTTERTDDLPRAQPAVEEKEEEEVLAVDDGGGFFF
jgi:hypothetical protein